MSSQSVTDTTTGAESTATTTRHGQRPTATYYQPDPLLFAQVGGASAQAIPASVRAFRSALSASETAFATELEAKVASAWSDVERVTQRNAERIAQLQDGIDRVLEDVKGVEFWNSDAVRAEFHIEDEDEATASVASASFAAADEGSPVAARGPANTDDVLSTMTGMTSSSVSQSLKPLSKIRLKSGRSTDERRQSSSEAAPRVQGKALLRSANESGPAPLRRLFRRLLERRDTLPKELTLLLNAIEGVQKTELVAIEAQLDASSLLVPVYVPLTRVAVLLNKHFTKPSQGADDERAFVDAFKPLLRELDQSYTSLRALWSAEDTTSASKSEATELMWRTLLTEVATRRDFNEDCGAIVERIAEFTSELSQSMPRALQQCSKEVAVDFAAIRADAATVEDGARATYAQAQAAKQALEAAYARDRKAIDDALAESMYKLSKSQSAQEKCARRVREAYKEFCREQAKHVAYVEEYVHLKTVSAQIDTSAQQLRDVVESRMDRAHEAQTTSASLQTLLSSSEGVCQHLLQECERHTARMVSEEEFRRCRVVSYGVDNTAKWLRCANDLAALYGARHEAVEQKSESSWQLEYLLTHERQRSRLNLEAVRGELLAVERSWATIQARVQALQMPVPAVDRYDRTEDASQMRLVLVSVDDDSVVSKMQAHLADRDAVVGLSRVPPARRAWKEQMAAVRNRRNEPTRPSDRDAADSSSSRGDHTTTRRRVPSAGGGARGGSARLHPTAGEPLLPRIPLREPAATPRPPHRDAHQAKVLH